MVGFFHPPVVIGGFTTVFPTARVLCFFFATKMWLFASCVRILTKRNCNACCGKLANNNKKSTRSNVITRVWNLLSRPFSVKSSETLSKSWNREISECVNDRTIDRSIVNKAPPTHDNQRVSRIVVRLKKSFCQTSEIEKKKLFRRIEAKKWNLIKIRSAPRLLEALLVIVCLIVR